MVTEIDNFNLALSDCPREALIGLGLCDTRPREPYEGVHGKFLAKLANVFLRAVIVDRILWALCIGILEPFTQYLNDDFPHEGLTLDMSRFDGNISSMAQCLVVLSDDRGVEFSESLYGDNLRCGVSSITHGGMGTFHNVISQLYFAATLILFLGIVSEMGHIYSIKD
jgi:hypothetical protein